MGCYPQLSNELTHTPAKRANIWSHQQANLHGHKQAYPTASKWVNPHGHPMGRHTQPPNRPTHMASKWANTHGLQTGQHTWPPNGPTHRTSYGLTYMAFNQASIHGRQMGQNRQPTHGSTHIGTKLANTHGLNWPTYMAANGLTHIATKWANTHDPLMGPYTHPQSGANGLDYHWGKH